MASGSFGRISRREDYVVATLGTYTEDGFGNISESTDTTNTIEFWAMVEDDKANRVVDEGKRRNVDMKTLMCDSRDVANLTIDHRLVINNGSIRYIPVDIFQNEFKYEATIIVKAEN